MVDVTLAFMAMQTISITVGVIYHILTLRNTRKNQELQLETRQAQLFMNIHQITAQPEFVKASRQILLSEWNTVEDFFKDFDFYNKEAPDTEIMTSIYHLMSFYEGVGLLVREGLLDIRFVALTLAGTTKEVWERFLPIIDDIREEFYPRVFDGTEYLYNALMKYMEEHPELKT